MSTAASAHIPTRISPGMLRLALLVFAACVLAVFANAMRYSWFHGNPLIASDAWFFVDAFVRKLVDGDLGLIDFFVKRAGTDHAQPLNKLLLALNVVTVGMDFSYEGLAGLAFAGGAFAIVLLMVRREWPQAFHHPSALVCLVALFAVFLSLNSSELYTWPLVTMGFSLHFLSFLLVWFTWRAFQEDRWPALFAAGFLVCMLSDDSGFIIVAACVLALAVMAVPTSRYRDAARIGAVLLVSLLASRIVYALIALASGTPPGPESEAASHLEPLLKLLPDAGRWMIIPSAASIAQSKQLSHFFPESWENWQMGLGLIVLAGQLWFWSVLWRTRPSGIVFMAVAIMLLGYGYLAGILYGRVGNFGTDYLYQGRYVLMYSLVPMAILLLAVERMGMPRDRGRVGRAVLTLAASLAILVQIPMSRHTWADAPYVDRYFQEMADQMFAIARNPRAQPRGCVPLLTVCQWPAEQRARVFDVLQAHRLNLFSKEFIESHGMYEGDAR